MSNQYSQLPLVLPPYNLSQSGGPTIESKFAIFHRANPGVFTRLLELAIERRAEGKRRISMKLLFELLREDESLRTNGHGFKLSNSYSAEYTRLLLQADPSFRPLFETRPLRRLTPRVKAK